LRTSGNELQEEGGRISSIVLIGIFFLARQASISCSLTLEIIPGYAQANLPLDSLTCTQPEFVRFPVTGIDSLKDSTTLSRNGVGSERRLPFTKIVQTWLSGDGEGLGLGWFSEFLAEGDGFGEGSGDFGEGSEDDDTVSAESSEGAIDVRLKTLNAKPKPAKPPPIPISRSNLLRNLEAEGEVGFESAKLDGKFMAGIGSIGCITGTEVYSGSSSTSLGIKGTELSSFSKFA